MNKMSALKRIFFLGLAFLPLLSANAGSPVWTFTPLTPTHVSLAANGRDVVIYMVTNQSQRPHRLVLTPIQGIQQLALTSFDCSNNLTLGYHQFCFLTLPIFANKLAGNVLGGPRLCQGENPLQCYQPSPTDVLSIDVTSKLNLYSIGGSTVGLVGTVVLHNGTDTLSTSTDGSFTFPTLVTTEAAYNVTVQTQPSGQICTVSNGTGTVHRSDVTNVLVTCSANAYTLGGTVSGLSGSDSVSLVVNDQDTLLVNSNSNFTFTHPIAEGSPYFVLVKTQPSNQTCSVGSGFGVMPNHNVTNVTVTCATNTYTVGGTTSGLSSASSVVLNNNGNDALTISNNGNFTFPTALAEGSTYEVTVASQPTSQFCSVNNGTGAISGANVTNVDVTCVTGTATLSVPATAVIPVNSGTGILRVTNTGSVPVTNISAQLPSSWINVIQNASQCTSLAPQNSCNLSFSSTTPYIAQNGIVVTGTGVSNPPTTALAFSINNYLVFSVDSSTSATVVDSANVSGNVVWGNTVVTNATSLTNGFNNTALIISTPAIGTNAASLCYNSTAGGASIGEWYLPAICQLGGVNQGASCPSGIANIDTNLFQLGFRGEINFTADWSSTEITGLSEANLAWYQFFEINNGSTQATNYKLTTLPARCVRSIPY